MTITELAPTTFAIPTLETERLFLRGFRPADIDEEIAFFGSERARFVGGPLPERDVWRAIAALIGHWALRGYGFWALEDKASGRYMGRVGLWYPAGHPERELAWTLMDHAEGKGLAREAALAARTHAYTTLGWTTAISLIAPQNHRSQALAARLGATLEQSYQHEKLGPVQIWRHPGPDAPEGLA